MPNTEGVGDPTPSHIFYVTFGVKYRYEKHEHWPAAHPDGWLEVLAPDEEQARALVARFIGNVYAFMYDEARFSRVWHPKGRLALIDADGKVWQEEGVEPPTPLDLTPQPPQRTITVSWYTTEHYTANLPVPDDLDIEDEDALLQIICDGTWEDGTSDAYTGTTDRTIIEKEES